MPEKYSGVFPLEDSLCLNCNNRFSRTMIPLDYEVFNINVEDFDLEDGEDLFIEQHICLVSQEDLEGMVTECSHFKTKREDIPFFTGGLPV